MAASDIKNDATLSTGLVSVWLTDESGLTTDLHGSNNLTNNNAVSLVAGVQGDAGDFEESSSQYLSIADGSQTGLDFTGSFSINFWAKWESKPGGNEMSLVSKDSDGVGNDRQYRVDWKTSTDRIRFFVFRISDDSVIGTATADTFGAPSLATDYMITVVCDDDGNDVAISVNDGVQDTGALSESPTGGDGEFRIGAKDNNNFFDGIINQVVVWNKALSAQEISDLYNAGSGIPYDGGGGGGAVTPVPTLLTMNVG